MAGVNETDQLSWSVISQHSQFVHELNKTGSKLGLKGDYENKFDYLRTVRDNINQHLNDNEIEAVDKWEKIISKAINLKKMFGYILDNPEGIKSYELKQINSRYSKVSQGIPAMIRDYHRQLLKCMDRFGYFPKKKDQTSMSY